MGLLWMRTSAEYRALCYQAYNTALSSLDKAMKETPSRHKPFAIILDCDETVLDNTRAMGTYASRGKGYWDGWWWHDRVHEGKSAAMPGALDFLKQVSARGVEIFYVSNRYKPDNLDVTIDNLKTLGFPSADRNHVLLFTKNSDKMPRFAKIEKSHQVLLYLGDNAGDFPLGIKGKSLAERQHIIDTSAKDFGTRFIVLPNPAYGSWVSAMDPHYMKLPVEKRNDVNRKYLTK
jgi:5'-nucleotidase (lipoprotein e(P4) family)